MNAADERDQALKVLELNLIEISKTYKECFLSMGKGALLLYSSDVIKNKTPSKNHYMTNKKILEMFDDPKSKDDLRKLVDCYNPRMEGILVIITSYSNASFFVTVKLK